MTLVWDRARQYEGGTLLALLALADWSDDEGRCFPSRTQLGEKSRLTERQTYNVLKRLEDDGVLQRTGEVAVRDGAGWRFVKGSAGGRGRFVVYRINTAMFAGIQAGKAEKISGNAEPGNPEIGSAETLKSATGNPEICDSALYRTVSKPSERTVNTNPTPTPPRKREGVKIPKVDGMSWGRFRAALKQELFADAPLVAHRNLREIVPGEADFDACFRDWWLIGLDGGGGAGPPRLVTESGDAEHTAEGLRKYRKRIELLAVKHFGTAVEIVVREKQERAQWAGTR